MKRDSVKKKNKKGELQNKETASFTSKQAFICFPNMLTFGNGRKQTKKHVENT